MQLIIMVNMFYNQCWTLCSYTQTYGEKLLENYDVLRLATTGGRHLGQFKTLNLCAVTAVDPQWNLKDWEYSG